MCMLMDAYYPTNSLQSENGDATRQLLPFQSKNLPTLQSTDMLSVGPDLLKSAVSDIANIFPTTSTSAAPTNRTMQQIPGLDEDSLDEEDEEINDHENENVYEDDCDCHESIYFFLYYPIT